MKGGRAGRLNKGKTSSSNKGAMEGAPNRRQMRRMQANGVSSSRKPRRPTAPEEGASGKSKAKETSDHSEAEEGILIPAQSIPNQESWARKMHSIHDMSIIPDASDDDDEIILEEN